MRIPIVFATLLGASLASATSLANDCDWEMSGASSADKAISTGEVSGDFLDFVEEHYEFRDGLNRWDSWGRYEPRDPKLGFARLVNALLSFREIDTPANTGTSLEWAEDFLIDNIEPIVPDCNLDARARVGGAVTRGLEWIELGAPRRTRLGRRWFDEGSPTVRAAVLLHESRHHDGKLHCDRHCDCGGPSESCDWSWEDGGANTYGAAYLMDSFEVVPDGAGGRKFRNPHARSSECTPAYNYLQEMLQRYVEKPQFDPTTVCEDFVQPGDPLPDLPNATMPHERYETEALAPGGNPLGFVTPMSLIAYNAVFADDGREDTVGADIQTACFFVRISGRFEGLAENLAIRDGGLNRWVLQSSSSRESDNERLYGMARCASVASPVTTYMVELRGDAENKRVVLDEESSGSRACFLKSLSGKLNRSKDLMKVVPEEGRWVAYVERENLGSENDLIAEFQCVDATDVTYAWAKNTEIEISGSVGPEGAFSRVCAISGITGHMDGHKESVSIAPGAEYEESGTLFGKEGRWKLVAEDDRRADGEAVTGFATCFRPEYTQ